MRMRRLVLLVLAACSPPQFAPVPATAAPLAITHVTVVDVAGGLSLPDMTVVITGNRIAAVTTSDASAVPADARIVDAQGKFLIPGLWDMHVHAAWPAFARALGALFVANGVTGVRDMWGDRGVIADWSARVAARDASTPRIVAAGNLVDGPDPVWPNSIRVTSVADARRTVASLQDEGAPFIKVYSHLPREAYFAIADEAKRRGIPFAGHVPIVVTAAEASDAGQRSIEHLTGVALACSAREDELMRDITATVASRGWAAASALGRARAAEIASSFDAGRCHTVAAHFVRNGTWQVPTLTVLHNMAYLDDPSLENDPRLRYIPRAVRTRWNVRAAAIERRSSAAGARALYQREVEMVGALYRDGVPILAGTDELNPYCLPGFSLHDELARLVEAGLTPLAALQAATLAPAKFFNVSDRLGTVEAGKLADLVLLDADPLADIHNTTRIAAVVMNGRLIDGAGRQRLLDEAARADASPRR
jgi:amidohydrolase family protein